MVVLLVAGGGTFAYTMAVRQITPEADNQQVNSADQPADHAEDLPLKKLSGEEFRDLFRSVVYPNTAFLPTPPEITGDPVVDARIRRIAEERGYRQSLMPVASIVKVENEPRLGGDDLLQPLAAEAWARLKEAAADDGYAVSLTSAYRSPERQRELFTGRLYGLISLASLRAGRGDAQIAKILEVTAPPGYSRHHTGYTIDLWCEDGSGSFLASRCFDWMSANDYENAMKFGWIPSYPAGTSLQGPEPEPWEYVWVGDAVRR